MTKSAEINEIAKSIALADSSQRRTAIKNLTEVSGALASFAAELAATGCFAKETVLVTQSPSSFVEAAAKSNSIEIFNYFPTASDLIAIAAGDELSQMEYIFARILTNKDFIQLKGFESSNDQIWQDQISTLRDLFQRINASNLEQLIDEFPDEPIVLLATEIAASIARKAPVVLDGTRALLAASIIYEFSVAARSWLFVSDLPKSTAGQLIFKHRNWIQVAGNQVAVGDGISGIASLSLARTAALLIRQ